MVVQRDFDSIGTLQCRLEIMFWDSFINSVCESFLPQRASFSLRVSVMKAKNLMAKDANGENFKG